MKNRKHGEKSKKPTVDYTLLRKLLLEDRSWWRADNLPLPKPTEPKTAAFLKEVEDLGKRFPKLNLGWVFLGALAVAKGRSDYGSFPNDKRTEAKLKAIAQNLAWLNSHFKRGLHFRRDDPPLDCEPFKIVEALKAVVAHHQHFISTSVKEGRRGPTADSVYDRTILTLVSDLIEGGLKPEEAYNQIIVFLEKLSGCPVKQAEQVRKALRESFSRAAKKLLSSQKFPRKRRNF